LLFALGYTLSLSTTNAVAEWAPYHLIANTRCRRYVTSVFTILSFIGRDI